MIFRPRQKKVFRDLGLFKFRTFLAITVIAMSMTGIGTIAQARYILTEGMNQSFHITKPASGTLYLKSINPERLSEIQTVKGVERAEGRTMLNAKIQPATPGTKPDFRRWKALRLYAMDYHQQSMERVLSKSGHWPKPGGGLYLEENTLKSFHLHIGDDVWVETSNGKRRKMTITGTLQSPGEETTFLTKTGLGYIHPDDLKLFGYSKRWNWLSFTISGNKNDTQKAQDTAIRIKKFLEDRGIRVYSTHVPEKRQHWAFDIVQSMTIILEQLGILVFLAACGIVVNAIQSVLNHQTREIGVMQSIGATPRELSVMYFSSVLIYSAASLVIGIPLGLFGARCLTSFSMEMLGFDASTVGFSWRIIVFQVLAGIVLPQAACLWIILKGTRMSIREAINGSREQRKALFRTLRGGSCSLRLSFRNAFRKKARTALCLMALTLSGTVILSVFSIRSSMEKTNQNSLKYNQYDIQIHLKRPASIHQIALALKTVPEVKTFEVWNQVYGNRLRPDGTYSQDLKIYVPKIHSAFVKPDVIKGRWLQPEDKNAIVLDTYLLQSEKGIDIGDVITVDVNGSHKKLTVVGLIRKVSGEAASYANPHLLDSTGLDVNRGSLINIVTTHHSRDEVMMLTKKIIKAFTAHKQSVSSYRLTSDMADQQEARTDVLLIFLTAMALLILTVSAIGLTGNTSLNIMERMREMGVLRAIGANDIQIFRIITSESLVISFTAWFFSVLLSVPASLALTYEIGEALFRAPLDFAYAYSGITLWFLISAAVGIIAGWVPIRNCLKQPIRNVIASE